MPQKEISCDSKKFVATRRFLIISRNFLSQEEISCHRKKFLVTGRIFMSQEIYFAVEKYLREDIVWPIYPMGKLFKQKKEAKVKAFI